MRPMEVDDGGEYYSDGFDDDDDYGGGGGGGYGDDDTGDWATDTEDLDELLEDADDDDEYDGDAAGLLGDTPRLVAGGARPGGYNSGRRRTGGGRATHFDNLDRAAGGGTRQRCCVVLSLLALFVAGYIASGSIRNPPPPDGEDPTSDDVGQAQVPPPPPSPEGSDHGDGGGVANAGAGGGGDDGSSGTGTGGGRREHVDRIAVLGERNSGAQWLMSTLAECYPTVQVTRKLQRYGTWFQDDDSNWYDKDDVRHKHDPTLVVAVYLNPYNWADEMRRHPHNMPHHQDMDSWEEFLTTPWECDRPDEDADMVGLTGRVCQHDFEYNQVISCSKGTAPPSHDHSYDAHADGSQGGGDDGDRRTVRRRRKRRLGRYRRTKAAAEVPRANPIYELMRDGSGKPYGSILDLRADKIRNFASTADWEYVRGHVPVRYETLVDDPRGLLVVLDEIEEVTSLRRADGCDDGSNMRADPIGRHPKELGIGYINYMDEHVDWDTEAMIGYEVWENIFKGGVAGGEESSSDLDDLNGEASPASAEEDEGEGEDEDGEVGPTDCGCPSSCTEVVLNRRPNDYTCGERIRWAMGDSGGNMSEHDACKQVSSRFPTMCGPDCDPDLCGSTAAPTAAPTATPNAAAVANSTDVPDATVPGGDSSTNRADPDQSNPTDTTASSEPANGTDAHVDDAEDSTDAAGDGDDSGDGDDTDTDADADTTGGDTADGDDGDIDENDAEEAGGEMTDYGGNEEVPSGGTGGEGGNTGGGYANATGDGEAGDEDATDAGDGDGDASSGDDSDWNDAEDTGDDAAAGDDSDDAGENGDTGTKDTDANVEDAGDATSGGNTDGGDADDVDAEDEDADATAGGYSGGDADGPVAETASEDVDDASDGASGGMDTDEGGGTGGSGEDTNASGSENADEDAPVATHEDDAADEGGGDAEEGDTNDANNAIDDTGEPVDVHSDNDVGDDSDTDTDGAANDAAAPDSSSVAPTAAPR